MTIAIWYGVVWNHSPYDCLVPIFPVPVLFVSHRDLSRAPVTDCVPVCPCDRQAGQWSGLSWNHARRMPCGPEWQLGNRTTRITRTFFSSSIWLIPVFDCWTWNDNGRSRTGSVSLFLDKIHLNNSHGKVTLTGLKGGFQFGIERGTDLTRSL